MLNEAIGLQKLGHVVDVYAPTVSGNVFPELMRHVNVYEICSFIPRSFSLRDALGMLIASSTTPLIVNRFREYDAVVSHSQPSNWIALNIRKALKTPYVAYLHQPNRFLYPREIDILTGYNVNPNYKLLDSLHSFRRLLEGLDGASIRCAERVLVNSEWIKSSVDEIYGLESIVCYPGVDEKFFNIESITSESRDGRRYILSTNRHYPQKRLDYVIMSLPQVIRRHPDCTYVITGAFTSYTDYLKKLAKRLKVDDRVVFTDKVSEEELKRMYRNAYLYAYTSPEEDFGLGPLEAGACGVPSVVWDNAGPKETVLDGVTGYRVKPFEIRKLAEAQISLLEDAELRDRMSSNARRFVEERFTWDKHNEKLEAVLESIL